MTDTPRERDAQTGQPAEPPLLNIANILTMVRIALVPVFIWLLVLDAQGEVFGGSGEATNGGWRWAAAGVFALAVLTDKIDGDLARSRNLVTDFGKIADPIADKLLIGAGLVMLSLLGELPWWVTIVILARELGVTVLRMVVIRYGVMPASRGGKLKTVLQSAGLLLMLLPLVVIATWLADVAFWIMILALAVTVVTGVDYLISAIRMRRRVRQERADSAAAEHPRSPDDD
ncbi:MULTISPECIES: CDP-diacylglycerol--glycerol-3-phosphate 3-phosphatidyltransferase [unclassified Nesterenkonia]|uniref:CDP-diacylglycerol--glycerol-3-phosphate 3-phosphatidyltransferase n=1 Tax=unclassified Nesterenkonia TaxID=2629769 RepID=UPI001F4C5564|nr:MULTISPECIES: CDP-diacylglycerol--glycerol-3-phosphate 3-phosphatidyltransferase [unclassified Nesterenkonia]MCH8559609.1 CDP-diacylglycerol--glycerol-3-phosphate 3-phosphatidyltransferase [Nesterenkonia sp. DZ6]MCH8570304.1 CDP-diacylglycerol--glycerol-3-phosphate 3-phosphatidyltransferase [Nesterenkonia sp. AY15]